MRFLVSSHVLVSEIDYLELRNMLALISSVVFVLFLFFSFFPPIAMLLPLQDDVQQALVSSVQRLTCERTFFQPSGEMTPFRLRKYMLLLEVPIIFFACFFTSTFLTFAVAVSS